MDSLSDIEENMGAEMDDDQERMSTLSQESNYSSCTNLSQDSGLSSCADDEEAKTDLDILLKQVEGNSNDTTDSNLDSVHSEVPRCQTPTKSILRRDSSPLSPLKTDLNTNAGDDLPSPTANLKLLMSAISPEIRDRDLKLAKKTQEEEQEEKEAPKKRSKRPVVRKKLESSLDAAAQEELKKTPNEGGGRKEKSLGLLCQR